MLEKYQSFCHGNIKAFLILRLAAQSKLCDVKANEVASAGKVEQMGLRCRTHQCPGKLFLHLELTGALP